MTIFYSTFKLNIITYLDIVYIYIVYILSSRYIQQYCRLDQGLFVPRRIPLAAPGALGAWALWHGVPPSGMDIGGKNLGLETILLYKSLRDQIYIYNFDDYIQQYRPKTEAFFRPRPTPEPRHFFVLAEDEKMASLRGQKSEVDGLCCWIQIENNLYTIHIYKILYPLTYSIYTILYFS